MMKMTTDIGSNKIFNALLRTSLKAFVMKVFQEVSPSNQYSDNWHIYFTIFSIIFLAVGTIFQPADCQPYVRFNPFGSSITNMKA